MNKSHETDPNRYFATSAEIASPACKKEDTLAVFLRALHKDHR